MLPVPQGRGVSILRFTVQPPATNTYKDSLDYLLAITPPLDLYLVASSMGIHLWPYHYAASRCCIIGYLLSRRPIAYTWSCSPRFELSRCCVIYAAAAAAFLRCCARKNRYTNSTTIRMATTTMATTAPLLTWLPPPDPAAALADVGDTSGELLDLELLVAAALLVGLVLVTTAAVVLVLVRLGTGGSDSSPLTSCEAVAGSKVSYGVGSAYAQSGKPVPSGTPSGYLCFALSVITAETLGQMTYVLMYDSVHVELQSDQLVFDTVRAEARLLSLQTHTLGMNRLPVGNTSKQPSGSTSPKSIRSRHLGLQRRGI